MNLTLGIGDQDSRDEVNPLPPICGNGETMIVTRCAARTLQSADPRSAGHQLQAISHQLGYNPPSTAFVVFTLHQQNREVVMSHTPRLTLAAVVAPAMLFVLAAAVPRAQSPSLPNPYRVAEKWAQLPAGMQWAGVISVDPDAKDNIWVFHRSDPTILKFDPAGKLVASFGAGMFVQAHGMTIDRNGNVWVTDAQTKDGKGQQVFKLSPEGKVLMTLGKAGVAGEGPDTFNGPADVVVAPNGDIFVADGHAAMANGRIVKFSKDGVFVTAWGKT
jgi:streptogramin lyase